MRLFLLKFKWEKGNGFGLVFAEDEPKAVVVADKESKVRFGIRKTSASDFLVVGELKKSALFAWAQFIPCELSEEDFERV